MANTIKCGCSSCGAKYRLPVEAQGRTARCKRCGKKFQVPRSQSLEDTVVAWLGINEDDPDDTTKPRVITMPHDDEVEPSDAVKKMRGPIRLKSGESKEAESKSG